MRIQLGWTDVGLSFAESPAQPVIVLELWELTTGSLTVQTTRKMRACTPTFAVLLMLAVSNVHRTLCVCISLQLQVFAMRCLLPHTLYKHCIRA